VLADGSVEDRGLMQFGGGGQDIHDVIIQHIKFRRGVAGIGTNLTIRGGYNVLIDHVSFEWATVKSKSIGIEGFDGDEIKDFTIQNSIIAQGLGFATGFLAASKPSIGRVTSRISLHHNLFAHHGHRNPRFSAVKEAHFINNVVYNWNNRAGSTTLDAKVDFIGNYFKAGPWSNLQQVLLHEQSIRLLPGTVFPPLSLYIENNLALPILTDISEDNWALIKFSPSDTGTGPLPLNLRRYSPLYPPPIGVTTTSPEIAYTSVLNDVGSNARLDNQGNWVPRLDVIDRNIILDVHNGTGPAKVDENDHPDDFGGYPPIDLGELYLDTDKDGMPDTWETMHGLNPNDPQDGKDNADTDHYTNIEEFLNATNPNLAD